MKEKKVASSLMVAVSVFALKGLWAMPVFAQILVTCGTGFGIGNNAQCSDTPALTINPDGSTSLTGCLVTTSPVQAGQCTVKTTAPNTKMVLVDFATTFVNIKNGVNQVKVSALKMQHTATVPPASKFTFSPTDISNTITIDIGGKANVTASQALGTYTGNITVRANPL